jgi:hypothetical protein
MFQRYFTGSNSTPFDGPAGDERGSIKGLYVYRHGVCSTEVDLQTLMATLRDQAPSSFADTIGDIKEINFDGIYVQKLDTFNVASFVQKRNASAIEGGFVMAFALRFISGVPFIPDSVAGRNTTFTFGLDRGIVSATATQNSGTFDGDFRDYIEPKLDAKVNPSISGGIKLNALTQQAQPIPSPAPGCTNSTNPACFEACVGDGISDPATWPPQLDKSSPDDSSWYNASYCGPAAALLRAGVAEGAMAAGITSPADQNALANALTSKSPDGRFDNIRCNFYPTYVQGNPNVLGGRPKPVCEVVARAKRLNVFPDALELVWFDAPTLQSVGRDEYGNEAFALYLLAKGQGAEGKLCSRRPALDLRHRPFAHASEF